MNDFTKSRKTLWVLFCGCDLVAVMQSLRGHERNALLLGLAVLSGLLALAASRSKYFVGVLLSASLLLIGASFGVELARRSAGVSIAAIISIAVVVGPIAYLAIREERRRLR